MSFRCATLLLRSVCMSALVSETCAGKTPDCAKYKDVLPEGFLGVSAVPANRPFCIYLHDQVHDSWLSKTIATTGRLHALEEDFIEQAINSVLNARATKSRFSHSNCVHVLDIGGNIGWMALFAASVDERVCVTVVEPSSWHNTLLNSTIRLNNLGSRVHLIKALVGKEPGSDQCMLPDPRNGASTEVRSDLDAAKCAQQGGVMAPSTTIDQILASSPFGKKVHVMKMDTEGFEPFALAGAGEMMKKPPTFVCMEWIGWRITKMQRKLDPVQWLNLMFPPQNWSRAVAWGPSDEAGVARWLADWPSHQGGDLLMRRLTNGPRRVGAATL